VDQKAIGNQNKWCTVIAMCLLTVMLNIDLTALNIALPVIAHQFYATLPNMQWVIGAYVLMSALFQILGGKLADDYGHKKLFLIGAALFVVSSAVAGFSINDKMLIISRVFQGIALGLAYPTSVVLVTSVFPKKKKAFALSLIVGTMGLSLAIGPPVGGFIVHYIGWKWIFFINVPIGIITLILAYYYTPKSSRKKQIKIDYWGALFLIIGMAGVVLSVNQLQAWGYISWKTISSFIIGVVFLITLYFYDRNINSPIILFRLFKNKTFLLNNIVRILLQIIFIPALFFIPFYLQNIIGYSAVESGLVMLFLTVIIGLISPIAGKWIDMTGDKWATLLSMLFFAGASAVLYFLSTQVNLWVLGIGLVLMGIATGVSFISTLQGAMADLPEKNLGMGTGIFLTIAWLGAALGVSLMGSVVGITSKNYFYQHLPSDYLSFSPEQMDLLVRVSKGISPIRTLSENFASSLEPLVNKLTASAFVFGFKNGMLFLFVCSLIAVFLAFFIKNHRTKRRKKKKKKHPDLELIERKSAKS